MAGRRQARRTGTRRDGRTARTGWAARAAWATGRRRWAGSLLLLVLALGLSACAGSATSAEDAGAADQAVPAPLAGRDDAGGGGDLAGDDLAGEAADEDGQAQAGVADDAAAGDGAAGGEGSAGADAVDVGAAGVAQGRRVVTSSVDVAVDDVPAAARRVRAAAVAAGGFVAGESTTGGERPRAEITVRVPVEAGPDLLTAAAALGEEVARSAESEDVEATLVDLESRTATQRAGVERIRALLQEATSLEDVLALEAELTRRQADLESVQSRQSALADRAALATVTVVLTRPADVDVPTPAPPFLSGLAAGWDALLASTAVVLVVLGALLPFLVVALVLGAALLGALRLRRSRHPRPAVAGSAAAAPAPERAGVPAAAGPDSGDEQPRG
ncbi:DUF4349 domain-containing protein [Jannaschia sp. R86511]|uniref:DUF4349 domain-containing protein n=1 Tax=Jannaschia sp. R86511 TaxID=3093853 RepID=UPI0036D27A45